MHSSLGPDRTASDVDPEVRVTTLELFFDLVFVFTLTQLTAVLVDDMSWRSLAQIVLMFSVIWWMYDGYVWLSNAVSPDRTDRRALLMVGMVGFMVIALAIPGAFGDSGVAFAVGYATVIVAHFWLYRQCEVAVTRDTLPRLLAVNGTTAGLVLAAGVVGGGWSHGLWVAAILLLISTPYVVPPGNFRIRPAHFIERHGLVVIIALGESIVAIGIGAEGFAVDGGLVVLVALGLALSFALWWLYFEDDQRVEAAFTATDPLRRGITSIRGFYYAHTPLLVGVVVMAAGIKTTIGHAYEPLAAAPALALSGGAALFLIGHALFRRTLGLPGMANHLIGGVVVLGAAVLAETVDAYVHLAVILLVLTAIAAADRRTTQRAVAS